MPGSAQTCCVLLLALLGSSAAAPWNVGDIFATSFGRLHVIDAASLVGLALCCLCNYTAYWASLAHGHAAKQPVQSRKLCTSIQLQPLLYVS
jgi:hypothetical protein